MKTSDHGRKFIEQFEGLVLHTYNDGTGTLTIGYGHTSSAGPPAVRPGMVITQAQADAYLAQDLGRVELSVSQLVKVELNQNQFDALVSYDFNTGALGHSNVLADVNAKRFGAIPGDLLQWNHAKVNGQLVVMPGLTRRREAEGQLFMSKAAPLPLPPAPKPRPPVNVPPPTLWIIRLIEFFGSWV